jgi:hypothetical protein
MVGREQAGRVLNCNGQYATATSNPHFLHLAHADVVGALVVEAVGFGVRVPCHALRDLDTRAVRKVVLIPVARKVWQPIAVSMPAPAARRRIIYQDI